MQSHIHHHHQQQQQLAALLSSALPTVTTNTTDQDRSPPKPEVESTTDQDRASALDSLHLAIVYPPNSLLVHHSASFLFQGLSQLLSDRSHAVRRRAAVAHGALCAVECSLNGRQTSTAAVSELPDLFINWALPLIRDVGPGNGSMELALEALVEFFTVGEAPSAEGYVPAILKSCQDVLEDEKTSLNLLKRILSLLSLISQKYMSCFRPNFVDIIDLLLGWALTPDLSDSDRNVIMETFLQFRIHWVSNIHFSISLLSKFLDDMEVLIQDVGIDTAEHLGRFLALFSCFSTVLQATASEVVEGKPFKQMSESLKQIVPQLLRCLGMVGKQFGEHWTGELWRCLTFIAGIMKENFSDFYSAVISIFFQTLEVLPAYQLPGVLKANLQLLCLQKSRLLPSSVKSVLQFNFPFSMLRLHMNHHVVGNLATTYVFLLQHDSHEVISQAITSLTEELGLLISLLRRNCQTAEDNKDIHVGCVAGDVSDFTLGSIRDLSENELISLIKFDLKLLSGCFTSFSDSELSKDANFYIETLEKLTSFLITKVSPFQCPIGSFLELQVLVVRTLHKLSEFEILRRLTMANHSDRMILYKLDDGRKGEFRANSDQAFFITECLRNYGMHIVRALSSSSPLAVKLEALEWIGGICRAATAVDKDSNLVSSSKPWKLGSIGDHLLFAIIDAASDRERKVRFNVATMLERLLQARLINPGCFYLIADVALERLGDPDAATKNSYARVLSVVLPLTFYVYGVFEDKGILQKSGPMSTGKQHSLNWKQVLVLKQLPRQLHSQQLVSILSYISHRWKVPPSCWIHRLVSRCRATDDNLSPQHEERGSIDASTTCLDDEADRTILDRIFPVNNLAAVWWCINEAARYSVALRLRTNYGGPTQTFASLERMLLDVAHMLVLEKDRTDGTINIQTSNAHLLPMRLLLDFVESLKKNVYNAYEGSSILPSATRLSSSFFKANKKVCEEWFSRISEPMLNAGLAMQYYDAIIHYGALRLQELHDLMSALRDEKQGTPISESYCKYRAKLAADLLKVLRHITLALCRCHEPESLVGLQNWVIFKFSSLFIQENHMDQFSWIGGLVYQAQGQYEKAAAHFSHLLQSEDALSCLGSEGIQFIIARIIESYTSISDWKSLEIWLSELQAIRAMHTGKAYSGALTAAGNEINAVHALSHFDEGDTQSAWAYLDLTPKSSSEPTLDPRISLERSEYMLLRAMLQKDGKMENISELIEKSKLMVDEVLSAAPLDGLPEATPYATQLHCIFAFEEGNQTDCQQKVKQLSPMLNSLSQVLHLPISTIHQDPSIWLKLFRVYCNITPTSQVTMLFCQRLASLARKQGNFLLADRFSQYLRKNVSRFPEREFSDSVSTYLQYESILLSYSQGRHEEAFTGLWSMLHDCIISRGTTTSTAESCRVMMAKACLKLATWLRKETSSANLKNILNKIHADFAERGMPDLSTDRSGISSSTVLGLASTAILEEVSGTVIKISCQLCPAMCKTWFSYASWCHSQATSCLNSNGKFLQSPALSTILEPELSLNRANLTEEEVFNVRAIITGFFQEFESKKVKIDDEKETVLFREENEVLLDSCVNQTIHLITSSSGGAATENSTGECPSSALASQLQTLLLTNSRIQKNDVSSYVNKLVDIWWMLRRRRVSLFKHAVYGYLQYLSYSSSQTQEHNQANFHTDHVREKTRICTLRATLYILQILLNFGVELRETIEPGLASGPLLPWQELTPQLFARLSSHPRQEIRIQLEGLLMMLAKISPWSIVYPILVDINNSEGEPPEELQRIYDCLLKIYPHLIKDVQLVISELGSMTVLWEEQWLSTLQDIHSDVVRRINMLKEEARRIADNPTLSHIEKNKINAAKYSAVMTPVIVALERRLASTSREPETSHEEWFQKEYGVQLKSALLSLKTPPVSLSALGDVWQPFSFLAESLANYQKKPIVSLNEVAPRLVTLSSSEVPMPGLEKQISVSDGSCIDPQGLVTISSFCENVSILPTKTKPKKLVILGSDGQKYIYLLKGREDLRLDARIMQLLQAINSFLCSSPYTSHSTAIRYYSVTPISGRAGLIQWVENVTSMYSVFKSWQNRVHAAKILASAADNTNNTVPPIPRPSDMFYGKIIPALKEKGVKKVISRRDWPHDVKRSVLLELMKETPKELLYREIWCASEGFNAFRSKSKRFSGSVAAMSMVGHILGLGDRHLDNILMDFCTGDVVHIDYNVCFDKGRRLKIPEIVPFRLTQIIETALGLTGTEGTFKTNCEDIIGVLRNNKDVILMMLEVFVWDPLVEWTRGDMLDEATIGGEEKKGMELAVSLSLFASRFQEIRFPLQEHHDLLISSLPAVQSTLEKLLVVLNQHEIISAVFYHADKERSDLVHREASAKSLLAEATAISEKALATFEVHCHEFGQAKSAAADKAQELFKWMEQHGRILDALRIGSIPKFQTLVKLSSMEEALSLTSAILIAGVPLTIVPEPTQVQCYDLDKDVYRLASELDNGLSRALESLQEYALALQRVLPLNYVKSSPVSGWAQILHLSVSKLSPEILSVTRRRATDLIKKIQGDHYDSVQERYQELILDMERYATDIDKLRDECSELLNSIGPDVESRSKEGILSALSRYMQPMGYSENQNDGSFISLRKGKHEGRKNIELEGNHDMKKEIFSILNKATGVLFEEVKLRVLEISHDSVGVVSTSGDDGFPSNSAMLFSQFEEQIEKSALIEGLLHELSHLVSSELSSSSQDATYSLEGNWASTCQVSTHLCRALMEQMLEVVLPEMITSIISYHSEVMEVFGSISQIRSSIDMALEQFAEVESERMSLLELETNYFVKVGLITEKKHALERAAASGRDHLSWEEAEELASEEEACRQQLEQLHQTWNQKDTRTSFLEKTKASIRLSLISSERHLSTLINIENEEDSHIRRSKILLAMLVGPFSKLESIDQQMASYGALASNSSGSTLPETPCFSSPESMWKLAGLLKANSFFMWKVGVIDTLLDSCIRNVSSFADLNLSFDQLCYLLKKKVEFQLQAHIGQYLRERVAPIFLACLENKNRPLQRLAEASMIFAFNQTGKDTEAAQKVQNMLEDYCNTHETARATRSAASLLQRRITELSGSLYNNALETVQMEWLYDQRLPYLGRKRAISYNILGNDELSPIVLNINRAKLLENLQSAMSLITRTLECLQDCERTSISAEAQLERAMGWACAGANISNSASTVLKSSGIPSEFHDHLVRRRQFLWAAQEQASNIMSICTPIMEFEASRDGLFRIPGETASSHSTDGRTWQQTYMNALTKLDISYHSFMRAEQEWKLAKSSTEDAAEHLFSVTNELCAASKKDKSASDDLQDNICTMRDCARDVCTSLSAFSRASKGYNVLTSECGSMLEEVLAITEDLHDVYSFGKEATGVRSTLVANLSKATMILLPLEASISADFASIEDAIARKTETSIGILQIRGQAICQAYSVRIQESCQLLRSLVPKITSCSEELCSAMIRLARTANVHAGNLHKALEGLGESEVLGSQGVVLSREELTSGSVSYGNREPTMTQDSQVQRCVETGVREPLQTEEWISPPDGIYSTSTESSMSSDRTDFFENSDRTQPCYSGLNALGSSSDSTTTLLDSKEGENVTFENLESESAKSENIISIASPSFLLDPSEHGQALPISTENAITSDPERTGKVLAENATPLDFKKAITMTCHKDKERVANQDVSASRATRGKNAYAVSVLKRVEMKLEGRENDANRSMSIGEQVNHLIKQATSVDNLCNMYEAMVVDPVGTLKSSGQVGDKFLYFLRSSTASTIPSSDRLRWHCNDEYEVWKLLPADTLDPLTYKGLSYMMFTSFYCRKLYHIYLGPIQTTNITCRHTSLMATVGRTLFLSPQSQSLVFAVASKVVVG